MKKLLFVPLIMLFLCRPSCEGLEKASSAAADDSPASADSLRTGSPSPKAEDNKKVVFDLIRSAGERMLAVLGNDELRQDARKDKVLEVLDPLLDMSLMAKLTLGRKHWLGLDEKQRKLFTDLFTEQIRVSYFEKLDIFTDEAMEYGEPVPQKKKFHMPTYILSKDQRIEVIYKLYRKEQAWKIYDMEIEGVSMIKSYRSQYNEFLRDNTFADLLERMKDKLRSAKGSDEPEDAKVPAEKKDSSASQ